MTRWHNLDGLRKHAKAQRDKTQKSRTGKRKKVKNACSHQFVYSLGVNAGVCCACGEQTEQRNREPIGDLQP